MEESKKLILKKNQSESIAQKFSSTPHIALETFDSNSIDNEDPNKSYSRPSSLIEKVILNKDSLLYTFEMMFGNGALGGIKNSDTIE